MPRSFPRWRAALPSSLPPRRPHLSQTPLCPLLALLLARPWSILLAGMNGGIVFPSVRQGGSRLQRATSPAEVVAPGVPVEPDPAAETDWRWLLLAASLGLNFLLLVALWAQHRLIALLLARLERSQADR